MTFANTANINMVNKDLQYFFSLLQTEIICPQTRNWTCHFTYNLLPHYLQKMQPHTLLHRNCWINLLCNVIWNVKVVTKQEILVIGLSFTYCLFRLVFTTS